MIRKKSLKDTKRENAQAMNYYARLSDKPLVDVPDGSVKRGPRVTRDGGLKRESEVQDEIVNFLMASKHVALVERHNSGMMQDGGRYVRFNIIMIPHSFRDRLAIRFRKPDLDVMLTDGRRLVIECKREGWREHGDDREREQSNYLAHVRKFGAIAIFAQSVDEVIVTMVAHGYR